MAPLVALLFRCGLVANVDVLAAIVSVESGGNPLAIAVNGDYELVRQPRDQGEAAAMARWLSEHRLSFDAGLGQVNSGNLERLGLDAASVFDACTNLRAASRVLEECLTRAGQRWRDPQRRLAAAVSCYNTGDLTRGFSNGYVGAVRAAGAPLRGAHGSGSPVDDALPVSMPEAFRANRGAEQAP